MPNPVRSKTLGAFNGDPGAFPGTLLYTVPVNLTAIVKTGLLYTGQGYGGEVYIYAVHAGSIALLCLTTPTAAVSALDKFEGFAPLEPGDTVHMSRSAGVCNSTGYIGGAELQGVAP